MPDTWRDIAEDSTLISQPQWRKLRRIKSWASIKGLMMSDAGTLLVGAESHATDRERRIEIAPDGETLVNEFTYS